MRSDFDAGVELPGDRLGEPFGRVAEEIGAEAHGDIDVFVAVDVLDAAVFAAGGNDRIDHLLPERLEAGDGARIGEMRAVIGGVFFGCPGPGSVAGDEFFERGLLRFREAALVALFDGFVWAEAGVGDSAAVQVGGPGDGAGTVRRCGSRCGGRLAGEQRLHDLQVVGEQLLERAVGGWSGGNDRSRRRGRSDGVRGHGGVEVSGECCDGGKIT